MTGDHDPDPRTGLTLAISELRRSVDVGFAQMQGQLGVILQRLDQQDRRGDEHGTRLDEHDARLRQVERHSVTHEDLDARHRRTTAVAGVLVAVLALIISTGVSLLVAVIT